VYLRIPFYYKCGRRKYETDEDERMKVDMASLKNESPFASGIAFKG
jgi:hypothetical protein